MQFRLLFSYGRGIAVLVRQPRRGSPRLY